MTILDTLKALNTAEEADNLFITAATINLYNESIRRIRGQVLYAPTDVRNLLQMLELLLGATKPEVAQFAPKASRRKLSQTEEEQILKAIEAETVQDIDEVIQSKAVN